MRIALWATVAVVALACAQPAPARDHVPAADVVKTAAAAGQFRTLLNCLIAADLLDALRGDGPFIVFAPTDAAFDKLPRGTVEALLKPENKDRLVALLKYHVVLKAGQPAARSDDTRADKAQGGADEPRTRPGTFTALSGEPLQITRDGHGFRVNDVTIQRPNVRCRNGSVQVIDQVLTPPAKATIPAVARKAGQFGTLLAALSAADLADVLAGPGPFTVFAPTDAAFEKLPRGTVAALLKPENKAQLVAVLKYHVIAGKVTAKDAVTAGTAKTLQGEAVTAAIVDGRLTIDKSTVIRSDVAADNGIIHVIDAVLIPKR